MYINKCIDKNQFHNFFHNNQGNILQFVYNKNDICSDVMWSDVSLTIDCRVKIKFVVYICSIVVYVLGLGISLNLCVKT